MVLRFKCLATWSCECGRDHHIPLRKILFEENILSKIDEVIDELNIGKKCLIVEDLTTRNLAGKDIRVNLENARYSVDEIIVERADDENVALVREKLQGFEFAIAVGGGTPIDVTKMATFERDIPFISFPTALSHDGIASPIASITTNNIKRSKKTSPPICVMADLGILFEAPVRMTAAGYGDLLAKLTSLKDWKLGRHDRGEYFCEKASELVFQASNDALSMIGPFKSPEQVKNLAEALVNSGVSMILAGSSRPASGSEHLFSHYLDLNAPKPALHGEQVVLGSILLSKYHALHNPKWWAQPEYQWHSVKSAIENVGLLVNIRSLGIERRLAVDALTKATTIRPERYTILHKRPASAAEADRLIQETSVS